ncbi:Type I restriction-modification system, restriction subunit R (EC [uncultured Gammaproteobacteria bacterium]|nr:Type I restriction-modification system, restriction subunit R (EC [uncultured Gammaproteobacteria bacterium]
MSRRIAADLYAQIIKIKPDWHSDDLDKGVIKVVMTSSYPMALNFQAPYHQSTKKDFGRQDETSR